jgi:hypothetical protein
VRALVTFALLAAAGAAACDRGDERPAAGEHAPSPRAGADETPSGARAEEGLIKIILQPDESADEIPAAPIELLIELDPPAGSDGWVEPLASEVNTALGSCAEAGGLPEVDVVLEVRSGAISGGEGEPPGDLVDCLVDGLDGSAVAELADAPRALRLRVGNPVP